MDRIKFYGTRGTSSLTNEKYMEFGGATTCVLLNLDDTPIMVDCGTGISNALDDLKEINELNLFISHSHLDHINGIPTLLSAFKDKKLHIWGKSFKGVTIQNSIYRMMNQDLWPVRADTYKNITFHEIKTAKVKVGNVTVSNMDSNHPGGCSLFRFDTNEDSVVTAFDFSHLDGYVLKLLKFARGCKTLIYDGYMTNLEVDQKPEWGHSSPEMGAYIGERLGCEETIITHFGVYDDVQLRKWEKELKASYPTLSFARSGRNHNELSKIVEIGTMLAGEKDNDALLVKIVETCMELTNADGGTLYLLEDKQLHFKVMINKTKRTKIICKKGSDEIPPVSVDGKNVCSAAARGKKLINIADCYNCEEYDFSGTKEYDKLNSYWTRSVFVLPLLDEFNDVVGILQLINSKDKNGKVISFEKSSEEILQSIANQASMAIVNSAYSEKINDLLYGFVKVMSVEIDERTPYNANHTRNMVSYGNKFLDYENNKKGKYAVDFKKKREIILAIWLHDIGKILTPIDIMNKDTRLGDLINDIRNRFERRYLLLKLALACRELTTTQYNKLEKEREHQLMTIHEINTAPLLTAELRVRLDEMFASTYKELDGSDKPVLTNDEYYKLSIVKGTLTKEERSLMEGHVTVTQKFLAELSFPKYYDQIPVYAGNHHEFLDGSGYPNHLTEKDLPWPCRLITVFDIFEALIARDRPYKSPVSIEKAISVLNDMAEHGKLDKDIVKEFVAAKAWEE